MKTVRRIELLAPAKNVEIGQQAILHGADAVYIGHLVSGHAPPQVTASPI